MKKKSVVYSGSDVEGSTGPSRSPFSMYSTSNSIFYRDFSSKRPSTKSSQLHKSKKTPEFFYAKDGRDFRSVSKRTYVPPKRPIITSLPDSETLILKRKQPHRYKDHSDLIQTRTSTRKVQSSYQKDYVRPKTAINFDNINLTPTKKYINDLSHSRPKSRSDMYDTTYRCEYKKRPCTSSGGRNGYTNSCFDSTLITQRMVSDMAKKNRLGMSGYSLRGMKKKNYIEYDDVVNRRGQYDTISKVFHGRKEIGVVEGVRRDVGYRPVVQKKSLYRTTYKRDYKHDCGSSVKFGETVYSKHRGLRESNVGLSDTLVCGKKRLESMHPSIRMRLKRKYPLEFGDERTYQHKRRY